MGQSATLYRIAKDDFDLFNINKSYETFEKTFEGLRFVLSKEKTESGTELVEQIFYPRAFIGEQIDYSTLDFDHLPDDIDLLKQPVYYHEPTMVHEIADLLDTISIDQFQKNFDLDELNEKGIYARGIWHRKSGPTYAFNIEDMTKELLSLKEFYKLAKQERDSILSYVG